MLPIYYLLLEITNNKSHFRQNIYYACFITHVLLRMFYSLFVTFFIFFTFHMFFSHFTFFSTFYR